MDSIIFCDDVPDNESKFVSTNMNTQLKNMICSLVHLFLFFCVGGGGVDVLYISECKSVNELINIKDGLNAGSRLQGVMNVWINSILHNIAFY